MQAAIKLSARVLPGKRVEFTAPELTEGKEVELIVLKPEAAAPRRFSNVIEFLDSLSPIERTLEEWADVEREMHIVSPFATHNR